MTYLYEMVAELFSVGNKICLVIDDILYKLTWSLEKLSSFNAYR